MKDDSLLVNNIGKMDLPSENTTASTDPHRDSDNILCLSALPCIQPAEAVLSARPAFAKHLVGKDEDCDQHRDMYRCVDDNWNL